MKKLSCILLISSLVLTASARRGGDDRVPSNSNTPSQSQSSDDDNDDTIVESLREGINELPRAAWNAPTSKAKNNLRKQFVDRLKVAEKMADRRNYQGAIAILKTLLTRVDGQGVDWIKDIPNTAANEQQLVAAGIQEAIDALTALAQANTPRTSNSSDDDGGVHQNRRRGGR